MPVKEMILFFCLLVLSIFDFRLFRIPDFVLLAVFFILLAYDVFILSAGIMMPVLCSLFFVILFSLTAFFTKGLGAGDVKMAGVVAYAVGFFKTSFIFISACILGLLCFFIFRLLKVKTERLPFAPFATAGFVICEVFYGRIL